MPGREIESGRPSRDRTGRNRPSVRSLLILVAIAAFGAWGFALWYRSHQYVTRRLDGIGSRITARREVSDLLSEVMGDDSWIYRRTTRLNLIGTSATDGDLARLSEFINPTVLELAGTRVTDAGLAHLEVMTNLRFLDIQGTSITDAGLERLGRIASLEGLALDSTRVTDAGVMRIRRALPKARICWSPRAIASILPTGGQSPSPALQGER
jgi:hypothetical protein